MQPEYITVVVTSGPTAELVTVDDVKARLRITDTVDDSLITKNIVSARRFAERVTRRSLVTKNYAAYFSRFPLPPSQALELPVPPVTQVTAVKYMDDTLTQQTWDSSEYAVLLTSTHAKAAIMPKPGFIYPCPYRMPGAVEVDLVAGYGAEGGPALPDDYFEGICQLAAHIYEHPSAVSSEGLKEIPVAMMQFFKVSPLWEF